MKKNYVKIYNRILSEIKNSIRQKRKVHIKELCKTNNLGKETILKMFDEVTWTSIISNLISDLTYYNDRDNMVYNSFLTSTKRKTINNDDIVKKEKIKTVFNYNEKDECYYEEVIRTLKKQNKDLAKELTNFEKNFKKLGNKLTPIMLNKSQKITLPTDKSREGILFIGDTHVGEVVSPEQTYNFGKYDIETFIIRLQHIADTVKSHVIDSKKKLKKLHLILLGDIVSGNIHDELALNAHGDVTDWILVSYKSIVSLVEELKPYIEDEINIYGVPGNHGRMKAKPQYKNFYNNYDFITYKFIEEYYNGSRDSKVKCVFKKCFFDIADIHGNKFLFLHGNNIKSWAGIPFYGIDRSYKILSALLTNTGQRMDYMVMGHFHTGVDMARFGGEIIVNGSVIGNNEFSIANNFASTPSQTFLISEEGYGVKYKMMIPLDDKKIHDTNIRWNIYD